MNIRQEYEGREKKILAPYAQSSSQSLGRKYPEGECPLRTCFQRDMARIIHSTAFRALEYKAQIFVIDGENHNRSRLTHSLEVSQISKGLARILGLNEDLAQAIALAHDLGHSPFGHPGEKGLNTIMKEEGGFEHNLQSYRVVTELEERYPNFRGLNLTHEVLEGILGHTTAYDTPKSVDGFEFSGHLTIEAQIVNFADEIAFMNHDLDDCFGCGMLTLESLKGVPIWDETLKEVRAAVGAASEPVIRCRVVSSLINKLISDLQAETTRRIKGLGIKTLEDVREKGKDVVGFSDNMKKKTDEVRDYLNKNIYHHPQVLEMNERSRRIISDLFNYYLENPSVLPVGQGDIKRRICDHIASMTDHIALREHRKIFGPENLV